MMLHPFWPISMMLHPLADFHAITPFGRFTCCYTLWPIYMLLHRFWPIPMLLHPLADFHAVTPLLADLHALHMFPTLFPCMLLHPFMTNWPIYILLHLVPQFRPKYLLIHLLLFFLLASFYADSPPS
jgi:hypothetical protein